MVGCEISASLGFFLTLVSHSLSSGKKYFYFILHSCDPTKVTVNKDMDNIHILLLSRSL